MNKALGDQAELAFKLEAVKRGYIVSSPYGENAYDAIVDTGNRLLKIQVKSNNTNHESGFGIGVGRSNSSKVPYQKDDVDIFAIYLSSLDIWYFVPQYAVDGKVKIHLYPYNNSASKYEVFRSNWDIFNSFA